MFGQSIVFTYSDLKVVDADGNEHFYSEEVDGALAEEEEEDEEDEETTDEETAPEGEQEETSTEEGEGTDGSGEDADETDGEESSAPESDEGDSAGDDDSETEEETEKKPVKKSASAWLAQSADQKVFVVLGKLHGTDFTDTPAATDGVFSANTLAAQAEEALRERPELLAAIEKNPQVVSEFLSRVGVLDAIESNRVKGMQQAKDKQISKLKEDMKSLTDELSKSKDLVSASEAEINSLKAELAKVRNHSADLKAELAKEKENLLNVTGRALRVGSEKRVEGNTSRERLASLTRVSK
jgi:hypothetical protein